MGNPFLDRNRIRFGTRQMKMEFIETKGEERLKI